MIWGSLKDAAADGVGDKGDRWREAWFAFGWKLRLCPAGCGGPGRFEEAWVCVIIIAKSFWGMLYTRPCSWRVNCVNSYNPCMGSVNYKWALAQSIASDWTTRAFVIFLYGDWNQCCRSCLPSKSPRGVQGGVRWAVSRNSGETGLYIAGYFQESISWLQSLYLLISRKALNAFMVMSDPCD